MVINDFEHRLFNKLGKAFEPLGFELFMEKRQLRRSFGNGDFENIIFSVSPYENGDYWIEATFGVRKESVETLVQQFLSTNTSFRKDATTWHTNIGKFKGLKYFRYKVQSNVNFVKITDEIVDFFLKSGLPFMYGHRSLTEVNELLNVKPQHNSRFIHNQVSRCFKGIAVAKLIDSTELYNLIDTYRFTVIKHGNCKEIERFEQFVSFLLYYNPN